MGTALSIVATILVGIGILYGIKKYFEQLAFRKIADKIPGPPAKWVIGNILEFEQDRTKTLDRYYKQYGDIFRMYFASTPFIFLANPEYIQAVLNNKDGAYLQFDRMVLEPVIGNGLVRSKGEFWKRQRKLMNPVFNVSNLRKMFPIMVEMTNRLLDRWEGKLVEADGKLILDIHEEMQHLTLDVIGKCAFGIEFDFINGKLMAPDRKKAFQDFVNITNLSKKTHSSIPYLLEVSALFRSLITFGQDAKDLASRREALDKISKQIIEERRNQELGQSKDLLGLLMASREEGDTMSDEQICDEMRTFLLAGHDTTSGTLQWAYYHLSQNPEVELKLYQEAKQVLSKGDPEYDDVTSLKYATAITNETLRLQPVVPTFGRRAIKDTTLGSYNIPAGSYIVTSPWLVHRNPSVWENPCKFDPLRWAERDSEANPFSFFPFSSGPRACVGKNFSLIETKIILAMIAKRFTLKMADEALDVSVGITMAPSVLKMQISHRS